MSYENICFASEGNIALVTLNRPQRRNALSLALMQELIDCLSEIGSRRDLRAVILAANGTVFSAGHDLSEMVGRDVSEYRRLFDGCTELMEKLQSILRMLHLPHPESGSGCSVLRRWCLSAAPSGASALSRCCSRVS